MDGFGGVLFCEVPASSEHLPVEVWRRSPRGRAGRYQRLERREIGAPGPPTQRSPCGVASFFQNGAFVLRKSMMNSHAANASPRWDDAAATSTMGSPGASAPIRWTTVTAETGQRERASRTMPSNRALGHPGVMLEEHRADRPVVVLVPHHPEEGGHRPDPEGVFVETRDLPSGVERFGLHPDPHFLHP